MADARSRTGRWIARAARLAVLCALISPGSASTPAQTTPTQTTNPPAVVGPASPCPASLQESAQACSDRPLNAKAFLPIRVSPGLAWNVNAYVLKPAEYGQPYDTPLVDGGVAPYTGHTVGVLPDGMHIDAAGHLFGAPS